MLEAILWSLCPNRRKHPVERWKKLWKKWKRHSRSFLLLLEVVVLSPSFTLALHLVNVLFPFSYDKYCSFYMSSFYAFSFFIAPCKCFSITFYSKYFPFYVSSFCSFILALHLVFILCNYSNYCSFYMSFVLCFHFNSIYNWKRKFIECQFAHFNTVNESLLFIHTQFMLIWNLYFNIYLIT